ncbi:hypothetical protein V8G54_035032 [Vigna mungo]|uniref:Transmembrane protein n=1 Tax=Vigna mungo TaxID=3915 RepID=A0AAQ3RDZ1_VIGMU
MWLDVLKLKKKKLMKLKLKDKFGMKKPKLKFGGFFSFFGNSFVNLSFVLPLVLSPSSSPLFSPLKPLHLLVLPLVALIVLLICLLSFFLFSFCLLIHFFHFPFLLFIFHFFFRLGCRTMGRQAAARLCGPVDGGTPTQR